VFHDPFHFEQILRMMRGYDEDGNLLLPPRLAGEELPPELLEYYREQEEKMKEAKAKAKAEAEKLKLEGKGIWLPYFKSV